MTDRDTITLPREVAQEALEALEYAERNHGGDDCYAESAAALRTALAAPSEEVEALRRDAERWRKARAKYIAWQKGGKAEAMGEKR